jgi:hypothetical protein
MPSLPIQGTPTWVPGGAGSATPVWPAGYTPAAGHLAFLYTGVAEGQATLSAPSGWNDVPNQPANIQRIFWRKLTGGDALPTLAWVGAFKTAVTCVVLGGNVPSDVTVLFDTSTLRQASSTNNIVFNSLAISTDNEAILEFGFRTKTATGDGETVGNQSGFSQVLPAFVGSGTSVVLCVNYVQQTTKANIAAGGNILTKTDVSGTVRGFSLAIKTQAAPASASFLAGPAVNSVTAIPSAQVILGFTPSAAGTFYAVAVLPGSAAPSQAQILAGTDGSGTPALAAVNKAVTGADSVALGGAISVPSVDIHCYLHTTTDSPVAHIPGQFLKPTAGRQFVIVTGAPDPATDSILVGASPPAAAGDIIECDLATTPGAFALFMSSTGVPEYSGSGSPQRFSVRIYDISVNTWSPIVTDYVNDAPPVFVGGIGPLAFVLNASLAPVDLTSAFFDANGDPVTVTATDGLPPGVFVSGNKLVGAGTTQGIYNITLQGADPAGAFDTGSIVVIIGNVQVPQPLIGLAQADAESAITAARLVPKSVLVPSSQPEGTVFEVSPSEGASVAPFSAVVLSIATPLPSGGGDGGNPGDGNPGGSGGDQGGSSTPPPPIQDPGSIVARLSSVDLKISDVSQFWGNDLSLSNTQDLALVSGTLEGQQRILRRLLTNPGDYLFQPDYGAGLPAYIGKTADVAKITALITSQILLESVVAKTPAPVITVANAAGSSDASALAITISYTDAPTGSPQVLSFSLSK